jgi:hypothetical protein
VLYGPATETGDSPRAVKAKAVLASRALCVVSSVRTVQTVGHLAGCGRDSGRRSVQDRLPLHFM